ncbi:P-type DNA transfer protein VirB5 [Escherichia coli]|uniref:P-type DNA transfer protein VirB5 n=1 Tax=Pseudomonadota TaxID=1224 RepID=UPI001DA73FE1|nr:P-type DNA transfer protein VirB5 [Agrobacterium tumefaciens]EHR8682702.1 P-type DNA transfer protein VirB5 [Escherichia coli]EII9438390.1 P-type DNA transfer protein VirB5 [Salmonella enterica]EIL7138312.1 P-type DNA transfer protein VirB5 [Salmonella enterica]UXT53289.1 P-type DNA transfer protein VirB5 [Agrobacterium tumefaciens]
MSTIKVLAVLGVAGWMFFGTHANAQIPVSVTVDAPGTANHLETITKWVAQYKQLEAQIDQAKQQYQSLTGSRGLGSIMDDPKLRDYLPQDWQQVYDAVKNGGYEGLTGRGAQVYADNKVFDGCAFIPSEDAKKMCEAQAVKPSQDKAVALDAYDAAKSRLQQIDGLMRQINQTQDPKAIAELQGRISIEQAKIQNEATKLQLYSMVAAAEDKVQQQRAHEMSMKDAAKRGNLGVQPMNFSLRP